jgi:hypothetical protein
MVWQIHATVTKLRFYPTENLFGSSVVAVDDEPAWTFRDEDPQKENAEGEHGADKKGKPPSELRIDPRRIEEYDGGDSAEGSADPEGTVDRKIAPTAQARRHEFLNGRPDGAPLAAYAGTREQPKQGEAREIPRKSCGGRGQSIQPEGHEEDSFAAEPIGQPTEKQSAYDRASEIEA